MEHAVCQPCMPALLVSQSEASVPVDKRASECPGSIGGRVGIHPSLGTQITGLDLLASAALNQPSDEDFPLAVVSALAQPGPFNPAASLTVKTTKKFLSLEFVEMSDVVADAMSGITESPTTASHPPMTDISRWVERLAVLIASRFSHKAPKLLA